MINKKLNIIFLFLFLFSLALVQADPVQIGSMSNGDIRTSDLVGLDIDSFFTLFDNVSVTGYVQSYAGFDTFAMHVNDSVAIVTDCPDGGSGCIVNLSLHSLVGATGYDFYAESMGIPAFMNYTITVYDSSDDAYAWMQREIYMGHDGNARIIDTPQPVSVSGYNDYIFNSEDFLADTDDFILEFFNDTGGLETFEMDWVTGVLSDSFENFDITITQNYPDGHIINISGKNKDFNQIFYYYGRKIDKYWEESGVVGLTVSFSEESDLPEYDPEPTPTYAFPYQVATVPGVDLGYDDEVTLYMGNFFKNFDTIVIEYQEGATTSVLTTQRFSSLRCNKGEVQICGVRGELGDILITFTGLKNDFDSNATVSASNFLGVVSANFTISSENVSVIIDYDDVDTDELVSFVGVLTKVFDDIFPEKEELSLKHRFGYVFVTLMIVNVLLLFLNMKVGGDNRYLLYILVIINFILIFYFIAIKYVSLSFLIVFAVVGAVLGWLRLRNI